MRSQSLPQRRALRSLPPRREPSRVVAWLDERAGPIFLGFMLGVPAGVFLPVILWPAMFRVGEWLK